MEVKQNDRLINKIKKEYDAFIAGALLYLDSLDNVDFSLLIEDCEKNTGISFYGIWYFSRNYLGSYIQILKDGTIKLIDGVTLDQEIGDENCTLRDLLQTVAGEDIINYFKNLDIKKFKEEKEKKIADNRKNILENGNILLISDIQEDYDELVKYGFRNIDWFKSIVRANKYFAEHPDELQRYHIILRGNQNVTRCCFYGDVELENTIRKLRDKKGILSTYITKYDALGKVVTSLFDFPNRKELCSEDSTYEGIFDKIVECTLLNKTFEKVDTKGVKFEPIKDYINPNRLPLPTKKSDLRILYLDSVLDNEDAIKYAKRLSDKLGIQIVLKNDNNNSLGLYVKENLGDYDIIIASGMYSDNILGMNFESTEQCKDTGRDLTLLASYYHSSLWQIDEDDVCDYDGIGFKTSICYKFGGDLAPDSKLHNIEFSSLGRSFDFVDYENRKKWFDERCSKMLGLISSSVNIYNDALLKLGKEPISDLDLPSAEEFDKEYTIADDKEKERRNNALAPIKHFDYIARQVSLYLYFLSKRLTYKKPNNLNIYKNDKLIKVELLDQGKAVCAITFSNRFDTKNLRIFGIQTLTDSGELSSPERVGVYTRKYEKIDNVPSRPNESQERMLLMIEKAIIASLHPINEEAYKKERELEKKREAMKKEKKSKK